MYLVAVPWVRFVQPDFARSGIKPRVVVFNFVGCVLEVETVNGDLFLHL